jgi:hypothetical protein
MENGLYSGIQLLAQKTTLYSMLMIHWFFIPMIYRFLRMLKPFLICFGYAQDWK